MAKSMFPSMEGKEKREPRPPLTESFALEALHQKYPYQATALLNRVQRFVREYGPKDLRDYLNRTGLGNSLAVFERVRVVMLNHEREQTEWEAENPAAKAMFANSPGMLQARENSIRVSLGDRIRAAVNEGKNDLIRAHGPIDDMELERAQRTEVPANGDGEGEDQ